jgi:hypothetical protein
MTVPKLLSAGSKSLRLVPSGMFFKKMLVRGFKSLEPVGLIATVDPSSRAPFKTFTPFYTKHTIVKE